MGGSSSKPIEAKAPNIYGFKATTIHGEEVSLSKYEGKVCLIVNVATMWGLAETNYQQLAQLHDELEVKGLCILGFPCNQFGNQEPKSNAELLEWAEQNAVVWDLFEKVDVKGPDALPLYKCLQNHKNTQGTITNNIKWNFYKFLIDRNGVPQKRFKSLIEPLKCKNDIIFYLEQKVEQKSSEQETKSD